MHTYIKYPEVYEFNDEVSVESISNELKERGITNIFDDGEYKNVDGVTQECFIAFWRI